MKQNRRNQSGVGAVIVIVAVVVVIGVAALLWWAFTRNNATEDGQTQETSEPITITGTYFDAINTGRALQCDWTLDYEGEVMVPKGKLYTDGANRGLSEATTRGDDPKQTYTLVNDRHIYNWVVGVFGTQVNRANVEGLPFDEALIDDSQSIDLNAPYIFDCEAWTVDEAKLTPPSDVQFADLTS